MNNTKELPFAEGDTFEYEVIGDKKTEPETASAKILAISRGTNAIFVTNEQGFNFEFRIDRVLKHINDGRFTVKAAS